MNTFSAKSIKKIVKEIHDKKHCSQINLRSDQTSGSKDVLSCWRSIDCMLGHPVLVRFIILLIITIMLTNIL
jgi:hypothetical protein